MTPLAPETPESSFRRRWSSLAIAGFVAGCLSFMFCIVTGIPAVLFGIAAWIHIAASQGRLRGNYLSAAGVLLGVAGSWLGYHAIAHARDGERIFSSMSDMRQIGSAIKQRAVAHERYPSAVEVNPGEPPHSWRVSSLLYLGEGQLRGRYRFDEPWDSAHNRLLLTDVPLIYLAVADDELAPGATSMVAITGDDTMWPAHKKLGTHDLKDDPAETLLIIEVAHSGIPWTEPRDMPIEDFVKGIDQPGGPQTIYPQGLLGLFADGQIRIIPREASPEQLRALATRNGGERITLQFAEVGHD